VNVEWKNRGALDDERSDSDENDVDIKSRLSKTYKV